MPLFAVRENVMLLTSGIGPKITDTSDLADLIIDLSYVIETNYGPGTSEYKLKDKLLYFVSDKLKSTEKRLIIELMNRGYGHELLHRCIYSCGAQVPVPAIWPHLRLQQLTDAGKHEHII